MAATRDRRHLMGIILDCQVDEPPCARLRRACALPLWAGDTRVIYLGEFMATVDDIKARLAQVQYPGYQRDVVALGVVRDVELDGGRARVTLNPGTTKPDVVETLRAAVQSAVRSVGGVEYVDVRIVGNEARAAAANPFDERAPLPGVGSILAVASGKGGVGKSTVAVNLALALHARGLRVGLLDADIYGPSVPFMMGVPDVRPQMSEGKKIFPVERYGLALISMGFFLDDKSPVIWRGPMVMSIVRQFLKDVVWGTLDVLVIDLPPGTGDAQLTLVQQVPVSGGVIVTTPQDVALQDVQRGISMFQTVNAPVLGIVENMSFYECPSCGTHEDVFGHGGGQREAAALGVEFLGEIPLVPELRASMDRGAPIVVAQPASAVTGVFHAIAAKVASALERGEHGSTQPS
jgi:ATP-binding protein involved in chromosome partitioning